MQTTRIASIDKLRGLAMVIMALDHVRDFFHETAMTADPLDVTTTSPILFFTRWITHFCAPVFVFLSGTSAFLYGRNKSNREVGIFLIKRGLWLAIADIILINLVTTYNPTYNFIMLTTFWAIGCSMIVLGLLLLILPRLILPLGLLLLLSHDLLTTQKFGDTAGGSLMKIFFQGLFIVPVSSTHMIGFLYAILPWTSAMLLGYEFGRYVKNRRTIFLIGAGLTALFLMLRFINMYGDPSPWASQPEGMRTLLSFLNTSKYPPSLQFLCMTLGPALMLLSVLRNDETPAGNFLNTYGRVPFFYFVLHLFLAHLILVGAFYISGRSSSEILDPASPFLFRPKNFGFSLPVVYAVWISVVLLLYYPCIWYNRYKRTHSNWWLKYL